jgi:DNA-binding MarR family transcriptional regulator
MCAVLLEKSARRASYASILAIATRGDYEALQYPEVYDRVAPPRSRRTGGYVASRPANPSAIGPGEAERLASALDRVIFFHRKWYLQRWNNNAPAGGSIFTRYLLELLATSSEPWRMSDLANALGTSGRMVTSLVDGLEAQGLARRRDHPTDRRAILVELVAAPREARAPLREYHLDAGSLFDGLDPADRDAFLRVAGHLIARFRGEDPSADAAARPIEADRPRT